MKIIFLKDLKKKLRHFRVYLPLFNTLTDLELGIDSNSEFQFSYNHKVPLVFYGTSITQGGCASRPGLAYTNIISRKLNRVCINLGFSGNGHLETSIGGILSNLRNAIFIIDCMWNIEKRIISENTKSFINTIRSKINNLDLPIIFYEQYISNEDHPDKKLIKSIVEKNAILREQIDIQINEGIKNLYIFRQDGCINKDSEATIDGVHFNDLGFVRYSNHFIYHFKKLNLESHS